MRGIASFYWTLLILCLAGFSLGLVLHAITYFGIDPRAHLRSVWYVLQLSSAIGFLLTLLASRGTNRLNFDGPSLANTILMGGFGISLVYAIFNFFLVMIYLNQGSYPDVINGRYVLASHGAFHEISYADFLKHKAYEARMWSGHWMPLYLLTARDLYYRIRKETR